MLSKGPLFQGKLKVYPYTGFMIIESTWIVTLCCYVTCYTELGTYETIVVKFYKILSSFSSLKKFYILTGMIQACVVNIPRALRV